MAESIYVRGEGGSIILMDLPLPEAIQQRFDAGLIVRVNEDGSAWSDSAPEPTPEPDVEDADELAKDDVGPVRPDRANPKARWVEYAQLVSDLTREEAEALNKVELITRFGGR
jgi:hypothetical protein